jgi:phosphoglycerate dehydrogenase-like enzyme
MQHYAIYITEPAVIDADLVSRTFGDTPHTIIAGSADFTAGDCSECDTIIIRSKTHVDSLIRTLMPKLKNIVRAGTGLDNVDLDFCRENDIAVYNAPGANAKAVAEYVTTMSLVASRKIHLITPNDVKTWNRFIFTGKTITEQTIGIVGFGNIGRLAYDNFRGLGCTNFMVHDPFVTEAPDGVKLGSLEDILRGSDIITLHLPLLPATKHCINAEKIAFLRPGAIVINAARGGIVDEEAIVKAAQDGRLTYVADTVEGEPEINPLLLSTPNIVVTPHVASLTDSAERAMVTDAVTNLLADKQYAIKGA